VPDQEVASDYSLAEVSEFAPQVLQRATSAGPDHSIRVVLVRMEFEA